MTTGDRRRHGWSGTRYGGVVGLERLPLSRWHWRLVALVGVGTFFDLYEVFLGGVLTPVLAKEFALGTIGKSMVIAAGFAGMFIGANVLSIAADRLGGRRVFILNLLVYSVFSFAAAFSPNIETFLRRQRHRPRLRSLGRSVERRRCRGRPRHSTDADQEQRPGNGCLRRRLGRGTGDHRPIKARQTLPAPWRPRRRRCPRAAAASSRCRSLPAAVPARC